VDTSHSIRHAGATRLASVVACGRSRPKSVATSLLRGGSAIRTVQALLGHADVRTTMIYLHVMNRDALGVRSPFDRL
jgi:integrase